VDHDGQVVGSTGVTCELVDVGADALDSGSHQPRLHADDQLGIRRDRLGERIEVDIVAVTDVGLHADAALARVQERQDTCLRIRDHVASEAAEVVRPGRSCVDDRGHTRADAHEVGIGAARVDAWCP
jgi:hypothetical protein